MNWYEFAVLLLVKLGVPKYVPIWFVVGISIIYQKLGQWDGLALEWEMGFKHVKLEIDSNIVLQWLTKVGVYAPDIAPLIYDCRNFLAWD